MCGNGRRGEGIYVCQVGPGLSFLPPRVVLGRAAEYGIIRMRKTGGLRLWPKPVSGQVSQQACKHEMAFNSGLGWGKGENRKVRVDSEWQHDDIRTKPLPVTYFKRHRRALMNMGGNELARYSSLCLWIC